MISKTYPLHEGDRLVLSVDGGVWETVTFTARSFAAISAATAEEIVEVLEAVDGLEAVVGDDGILRLRSASRGGHSDLEVDLASSSAASALGLGAGSHSARGRGPAAACLVGRACEPFELPDGASMTVSVDGRRRRIVFGGTRGAQRRGKAARKITTFNAAEVAERIAAKQPGVARATRDGRVALTSRRLGSEAKLEIRPDDDNDAASVLGFVGSAAVCPVAEPEPAELTCPGQGGLELVNLGTGPLEIPLLSGAVTLAPGGALPLAHARGAAPHIERLLDRRLLGLRPVASPKPQIKE